MTQPPNDAAAALNRFWANVDSRVNGVAESTKNDMGVPRLRGMSLNYPIAGKDETPVAGWLHSVVLFHTCRLTAWQIMSLVPGQVTLDIRVSPMPASPATPPVLTSMPGVGNYPALNGYAVPSWDTNAWAIRDIQAGSTIHVYVLAATNIRQTVLGIQLLDLYGRVLQI